MTMQVHYLNLAPNDEQLVSDARLFAIGAFYGAGIKRKFTGEPYHVHMQDGQNILWGHFKLEMAGYLDVEIPHSEILESHEQAVMYAAYWLHDVIEDIPSITEEVLRTYFPDNVVDLVVELTHVYTAEAYPELNRHARKTKEAERLAKVSATAQTLKVVDVMANTAGIVGANPGFARTYLQECWDLTQVLTRANPRLRSRLVAQLLQEKEKLKK